MVDRNSGLSQTAFPSSTPPAGQRCVWRGRTGREVGGCGATKPQAGVRRGVGRGGAGRGERAWRCKRPAAVQFRSREHHNLAGWVSPTGGRGKGTGKTSCVNAFGCAIVGGGWRVVDVDVDVDVDVEVEEVSWGQKALAPGWLAGWLACLRAQDQLPSHPTFSHVQQSEQDTAPTPHGRSAAAQVGWLVLRRLHTGLSRVSESLRGEESGGAGEVREGGQSCGLWGGVPWGADGCV